MSTAHFDDQSARVASSTPAFTVTWALAAAAALATWEIFARGLAPFWIGGPLEPAGLIQSVASSGLLKGLIGDLGLTRSGAEILHILTGLIAYPLGYLLIVRPVSARMGAPWWLTAALYGVALWVFALYVMAHLIAGFPAFIGFGALTWASLVGHVAFALVLGAVVRFRTGS